MMFAIFVLAAAETAEAGPQTLHIPKLTSPTTPNLHDREIPRQNANPWFWTEGSRTTGNGLSAKLKSMYSNERTRLPDGSFDQATQEQYIAAIADMNNAIQQADGTVAAADASLAQSEADVTDEAVALGQANKQEHAQQSLLNAGVVVSNENLLAEKMWENALQQAGQAEGYIGSHANSNIDTLDYGADVLSVANVQLQDLNDDANVRASQLLESCQSPLYEWNRNASTQINEQTRGLVDLLGRSERLFKDFDRAHEKIVEMINVLGTMQKKVPSFLEERAKVALAKPPVPLVMGGDGLHKTGFWDKLHVLKDMFEAEYDEALEPVELIKKKFHDA